MSEHVPDEETIFTSALALPAAERRAFVERASAGHAALGARVLALLRGYEGSSAYLESPPALDFTGASPDRAPPPLAGEQLLGDRIGPYKLLERIGEGGCGVVYMAEQDTIVRRRVALKIIKLGLDTESFIARFEAERQALALMDHPGIARIFEAGATATGRPFFVMELIRGVPITRYCDDHHLATAARLELFIQVCHAIHHAHEKGIIHRDLKPSNILVTVNNGAPVPKIIDFGIAKATAGPLTDRTLFTRLFALIGTPVYASPEQVEMSSVEVDPRSDVYSLGVLLYELLTGRTPFDREALERASLDELRRTIREVEPLRPSARVSSLSAAERTTVASRQNLEAGVLALTLRSDLDWIVMRCLEKDRHTRYRTALELAQDLRRFLDHEPVQARPPTFGYVVRKFVRRRRQRLAVSAAFVGLSVVFAAAGAWLFVRHQRAAEQLAEQTRVMRAMEEEMGKLRRGVAGFAGAQTRAREALPGGNLNQKEIDARVYSEIAQTLGIDERLLRERLPAIAEDLRHSPDSSANDRANAAFVAKDFVEAERLALRAAAEAQEAGSSRATEAIAAFELAGAAARERIEYADALGRYQEAARLTDRSRDALEWARVQSGVGRALDLLGQYREAESTFRAVLAERQRVLGEEHPDTLMARSFWANTLIRLDQFAAAEAEHRAIQGIRERVLGIDHPDTWKSRYDAALAAMEQGKTAAAEPELRAVAAAHARLLGPEHTQTLESRHAITRVLLEMHRYDEAEAECQSLVPLSEKILGPEHPDTLARRTILANVYYRKRRFAQAEAEYRALVEISERELGPDHPATLRRRSNVANAVSAQGRSAEAETIQRAVVATRERVFGSQHSDTMVARFNLGLILAGGQRLDEARTEFEALVATMQQRVSSPPGGDLLWGQAHLAYYQLFARDFAGALATSESALQLNPASLVLQTNRAHALLFLGRTAEAEQLYLKHRGEMLARTATSWENAILDDFDELEEGGLTHPEFARLRAILNTPAPAN